MSETPITARSGRSRSVRNNVIAAVVTIAVLVACALWVWPGFLKGAGAERDRTASQARDLAEAFARADPEAMKVLVPEDGSDRSLLTAEAAKAILGENPGITVARHNSLRDDSRAEYTITYLTASGPATVELSLVSSQGQDGPWIPEPLPVPRLVVSFGADEAGPRPSEARLNVNGTTFTLPLARSDVARPTFPGTLTLSPANTDAATTITATPELVTLRAGGSTSSFPSVQLSYGKGDTFEAASTQAVQDYLETCLKQGAQQTADCPFAPPLLGKGVNERRGVSYSRPVVLSAKSTRLTPLARDLRIEGRVSSAWEERTGSTWTRANGSNDFEVSGNLLPDGAGLRFVPWEGIGSRGQYSRASGDTDYGSVYSKYS